MTINIVFLSSESTHHYYLINEIHKSHPVKKVFFETIYTRPKPLAERIKRWINPANCASVCRGFLDKVLFNRGERAREEQFDREFLFKNEAPALNPAIPKDIVRSFNEDEAVKKVRAESPDLIIVFGTGILKGDILKSARVAILNIHRGILPKYRGGGIPAWAFYHNDFENIGTTVHVCSEKLDAGDIVGQKFYRLQKGDRLYMLRSKTTVLAAEILKDVINKVKSGTLEYQKQTLSAKAWSAKGLTPVKQLIVRRNFNKYIESLP
jgi:folate-dependent phosphoribosylglycinamide formyltransferase PurN